MTVMTVAAIILTLGGVLGLVYVVVAGLGRFNNHGDDTVLVEFAAGLFAVVCILSGVFGLANGFHLG